MCGQYHESLSNDKKCNRYFYVCRYSVVPVRFPEWSLKWFFISQKVLSYECNILKIRYK